MKKILIISMLLIQARYFHHAKEKYNASCKGLELSVLVILRLEKLHTSNLILVFVIFLNLVFIMVQMQ